MQLYRDFLGSQAGELTIVGDFDAEACLPILNDTLAGWKAAKPYARIASPIQTRRPGLTTHDQHARQGECDVHRRTVVSDAR